MEVIRYSRIKESELTDRKRDSVDFSGNRKKVKRNKVNSAFNVLKIKGGRVKADFTNTRYPVVRECAEELGWETFDSVA
jgi:hypothetical protein